MTDKGEPTLRGLTIKQPWAWLIVHGYKTIENRTWWTAHRGPMAIVAGRRTDPAGHRLARKLKIEVPAELPNGIVAIVTLVDVRHITDLPAAERRSPYASGPYCWTLDRPRLLPAPIPYRGNVRLLRIAWTEIAARLPADVAAELQAHSIDASPEPGSTCRGPRRSS